MIRAAIFTRRMTLIQVALLLREYGFKTTVVHLSKLQNGKTPPGSDKFNDAISAVLGIDSLELKAAAYREKIPQEVLEKLQSHSKVNSA